MGKGTSKEKDVNNYSAVFENCMLWSCIESIIVGAWLLGKSIIKYKACRESRSKGQVQHGSKNFYFSKSVEGASLWEAEFTGG